MNINPGELNKRIQFINTTISQDADGFSVPSSNMFYSCNAKVTNTSGTELIKANAEFSESKKRFLIRFTEKGLSNDMKILYRGKNYEILYMNDYEDAHEYIEIFTKLLELS